MPDNICLKDRIKEAEELGKLYKESSNIKHIKSDMDAMKPLLADAERALSNAVNLYGTLKELDISPQYDTSAIREKLEEIKSGLCKDEFKYASAQLLANDAKQVEKYMNDNWKGYIKRRTADAKSIILSVREMVDDNTKYKSMNAAEIRYSQAKPGSADALAAIDDYLCQYHELMKELNLSDEVFAFVTRLTGKQAISLDELDEECLKALKASNFAKKMKIVINCD